MFRRVRLLVFTSLAAGALLLLPPPTPLTALGPCEEEPTCHPYLQRDCAAGNCRCWECWSGGEICCMLPI